MYNGFSEKIKHTSHVALLYNSIMKYLKLYTSLSRATHIYGRSL